LPEYPARELAAAKAWVFLRARFRKFAVRFEESDIQKERHLWTRLQLPHGCGLDILPLHASRLCDGIKGRRCKHLIISDGRRIHG
jgi:hypothetical protein